jgi:peptidoglycan/xylan/chitin deacetylase (PgdA/CDA1 family)
MSTRAKAVVERAADIVLRRFGFLRLVRALDHHEPVLRILGYHRVCDPQDDPLHGDPNVISATPRGFAEQIRVLSRHYAPIGWPELQASLESRRPLPRKAVLVTFDDGYRDFLTDAWPILRAHGVPAVLFVSTGFPGSDRRFWWDVIWQQTSQAAFATFNIPGIGAVDLRSPRTRWQLVRRLVRELRPVRPEVIEERVTALRLALGTTASGPPPVLSWTELRQLAREGVTVASHGRSHASLPALTGEEIGAEIQQSQADLGRELGMAPGIFAYPFGHYDERAAGRLKDHRFLAALGTIPGRNAIPVGNQYALFRHTVNIRHTLSRVQFGLSGFYRSANVS